MIDGHSAASMLLKNETASMALEFIGEAVLRTDASDNVIYLNGTAEAMTGWESETALGRPVGDVLQIIDGISRAVIRNSVASGMLEHKTNMNCILIRRGGLEFGIELVVKHTHDNDGNAAGIVFAFHDVTAVRAKSVEMLRLAHHDSLTGLPNRTLFNDRLKQAISLAVRQGKQLAVMFVDLDHFKNINDSLGHAAGDRLLQSVAKRLVTCVRRTDTVSRIGGDEFVVLLSQVEHGEDAAVSARKILRVLGLPHIIDNKSLDIQVSIGVSAYPSDGLDVDSLMDSADTAMYDAKEHGRNNYQFFRSDMHARVAKKKLIERDLRYALGRNEFLLNYQPKFNLHTRKITGVEALIRWKHPKQGTVSPAHFVPIAEECGLMLPIGQWVLLEACRQARAWSDAGLGIVPVSVNVSAAEFVDKNFLSGVRAILISTGVEPQNLELEMTESVLMVDAESTLVTLSALKAMGIHLAIDDFGTGFSSFTYLRRFPVDTLKLDQSFIHEINADPGDGAIVNAMINIGANLKLRVVAEGVETLAQLNFLQQHACAEGQGYYLSHPVAADQAGKLVEAAI